MAAHGIKAWLWGPSSSLGLVVAATTFVIDQASKYWVIAVYGIEAKGRVAVLPFLDLAYTKNTGISYSLFDSSSPTWQIVLAVFATAAATAMWVWMAQPATGKPLAVALGLIVGGALGNGLDRILLGGVADFFSLHAFGFYWYIFNIADVAIVAGVVLLLYDSWWGSRKGAANTL